MTTDLHAIAEKLNLAVVRLRTFDREAQRAAYADICEAAFWLSTLLGEDPVAASIEAAIKEGE